MSREIRIAWYGCLADKVGKREELLATAARTARELLDEVSALHALGGALNDARIAVNDEFAAPDQQLRAGDIVAFMPPFSGG